MLDARIFVRVLAILAARDADRTLRHHHKGPSKSCGAPQAYIGLLAFLQLSSRGFQTRRLFRSRRFRPFAIMPPVPGSKVTRPRRDSGWSTWPKRGVTFGTASERWPLANDRAAPRTNGHDRFAAEHRSFSQCGSGGPQIHHDSPEHRVHQKTTPYRGDWESTPHGVPWPKNGLWVSWHRESDVDSSGTSTAPSSPWNTNAALERQKRPTGRKLAEPRITPVSRRKRSAPAGLVDQRPARHLGKVESRSAIQIANRPFEPRRAVDV